MALRLCLQLVLVSAILTLLPAIIPNFGSVFASEATPSEECQQAIDIANQFLPTLNLNPADYQLIKVENLVVTGDHYLAPQIWRLTYKLRDLIPEDGGEIGAGGEVFIQVDISTGVARLQGFGE